MKEETNNILKAHQIYKNKDGIIVPGVTTVLSILAKPALIHWAWDLGIKGIDYRKVKDNEANIGTLAHYLIECDDRGIQPDISRYSPANLDKAENAYLALLDWEKGFGEFEIVVIEQPLVCDVFGGTLDKVIKKDNEYILIDYKTSKGIYFEMKVQLSAYKYLWNFNYPEREIKTCYIFRLGKEDGSFESQRYDDLERELSLFLSLLEVYTLKKEIENK